MRVSPAYIAGFGTAGSLLAGAAVLFVLATALVGFRGWPTSVGTGSPPRAVVNLKQPPLGGSRLARRLQVVAAADATRAPGAGRRFGGPAAGHGAFSLLVVARHAAGQRPGGSYSPTGSAGSHGGPVTRPGGPGAGPIPGAPGPVPGTPGAGPGPPPCSTDCGSSSAGPLRKVIDTAKHGVQTVAGGAGHAVDQTGRTVGTGVGAATGTVDGGAGHPAGGVVSKVGSAAGGVVSKVGSTAGSVLSRVGNAVGG